MFSVGEYVVYGAEGVCRVADIEELDLTGEPLKYYVLAPESDRSSKIFVPVENSKLTDRISAMLTEGEIRELLSDFSEGESVWADSTNLRKARYHEIVNSGDRTRIIRLVRELHARHRSIKGTGHRFSLTDEHYYKLAQRILFDEFSRVIPVKQSDFLDLLTQKQ